MNNANQIYVQKAKEVHQSDWEMWKEEGKKLNPPAETDEEIYLHFTNVSVIVNMCLNDSIYMLVETMYQTQQSGSDAIYSLVGALSNFKR